MDVDPHPSGSDPITSLGPPFSFLPDKGHKHHPIPAELSAKLNEYSDDLAWSYVLAKAGDNESKWRKLIASVLASAIIVLANTDQKASSLDAQKIVAGFSEKELIEWKERVRNGVIHGNWDLVNHLKLQATISRSRNMESQIFYVYTLLSKAYNTPFLGDAPQEFVKYLLRTEREVQRDAQFLYAKAIPVVQSSGTGKSRMLTETGKKVFTLPICLRRPGDPGYPPTDQGVYEYFSSLMTSNDLSLTAHWGITCFLAASHEVMLHRLKGRKKEGHDGPALLTWWHQVMEEQKQQEYRNTFFSDVVEKAKDMRAKRPSEDLGKSPSRSPDGKLEIDIESIAKDFYGRKAEAAAVDLLNFIATLGGGIPTLCVTYFDEADELGDLIWILLRLASHQPESTAMWYVFMATKSSIGYFHPDVMKRVSFRLRAELKRLLPPYFDLGFDQYAIDESKSSKSVTMGELRSLRHLCKYGRPMWNAMLPESDVLIDKALIKDAGLKLTNAAEFNDEDQNHVLAVLSQRLGIDLVLAASEAIELADRSVSHHMRLLIVMSSPPRIFYTYSPSEPILALAATQALYQSKNTWSKVLNTFSTKLCESGVIEKGLLGELAARTLLVIARDFVAPTKRGAVVVQRDMLEPIPLLNFFDQLFGNKGWSESHRESFETTFRGAYLNFMHWIITKDTLPNNADSQLLPNLWARQAALQCAFNQESIDLLIPAYMGSVTPDAIMDPTMFTGIVVQVKYKTKADTTVEDDVRPIGIPCDPYAPLPYIAFLMELGTESCYKRTGEKFKSTPWKNDKNVTFGELVQKWIDAVKQHTECKARENPAPKTEINKLRKDMEQKRWDMDCYNRYSISARGASDVYGILSEAEVTDAFATLLRVTLPSPTHQRETIQHMRPLERLGKKSGHTDWMTEYTYECDAMSL